MPMLIYWPMIVWIGMLETAQESLLVPVDKRRSRGAASRQRPRDFLDLDVRQ